LWALKSFVLRRMEAVPDSAATLHTTISPTILSAGIKENVIPPVARGVINFRLHPRDTIKSVTAHVKDAIGDAKVDIAEREETISEATKIADVNGPAFTVHLGLDQIDLWRSIGTGDHDGSHRFASLHADRGRVLRFRPYHEDAADLARVHGTNERVAISDLGPAVGFYMRLIQELK
jgi:carboxypeptidase PM20D1